MLYLPKQKDNNMTKFYFKRFKNCNNKNEIIYKIAIFGYLIQVYHNKKSHAIKIYYGNR